ncbi:MAG TPA: hypothetical protein V6D25_26975 [Leptolyngbyaceae cyanobacterium]
MQIGQLYLMRRDREMTTFQFGELRLKNRQLEDAGITLNMPINILEFTIKKTIETEETSSHQEIRSILSAMGLFCLHNDDWGVLIDCYNSNLSEIKVIADKIIDKYDGNISVFLEYQQFA